MDSRFRYYDARAEHKEKSEKQAKDTLPTEFFRGRDRNEAAKARTYVHKDTVARKTEATLATKADAYFRQIRDHEPALQFEPFRQTRMISETAHLGYSAITSGSYNDAQGRAIRWVFYFSNFDCVFGKGENLFENIPTSYGLTYFVLAVELDGDNQVKALDTSFRGNGLMFSTRDPNIAFANVVKLKRLQYPG